MRQAVIGRQPELARIDARLARVPDGMRVLLIEGEPGMGKTTLWIAAVEAAAGRSWRILSARPSDAEATFAYSGLGDLLETAFEDALEPLPSPQRKALRVALLREEPEGPQADPGAVAVAFLNALRGLAREGPILVAVDDIQWLDSPSALALGFALRRLRHEPIGVLLARRIEARVHLPLGLDRPLLGEPLERIAVGPLGLGPLAEIIHARLDLPFPRGTIQRIHAASGGNPLFALELGRALGSEPARLEAGVDLTLPEELVALLGEQVAGLPAETQDALAIVAALAHPTVELLAQVVDGPVDRWLQPALDAHVLEVDGGRIRFTHPLRGAAALSRASPARRREIHARLASIVADPEERARHLALAAHAPDEATAEALEEAARRVVARGAPDAASELAALAGRLTPPDRTDDIRRRGLAEAEYARSAGDPLRARQIVDSLLVTWPPGPDRVEALILLAFVHLGLDLRVALAIAREALAESGNDDRLRMRCHGMLTGALDVLGEDTPAALAHGFGELELAERLGDEVSVATALRGIARNQQRLTGRMPVELIERSLAMEPLVRLSRTVSSWPSVCHAEMLAWSDDLAAGVSLWHWLCQEATNRGEEHSLGWILADMIPYECIAGAWQQALAHAAECFDLGLAAGQVSLHAVALADRALVEAYLGHEAAARRDADEARRLGAPLSALKAERAAAWALGLLELSLGDPARAHDQLGPLVQGRRAAGIGEPGDMRCVTDEIEALIGMGRLAEAEALLVWYDGLAQASGRVFALAACDRSRGLLLAGRGELDEALAALDGSRTRYATIADPFGLGRTLLVLGSIQRRALHRHAARESLGASLGVFEGLGAKLWAERATAELARIGGRQAAGDELTPSERKVAALVAEGHTNREVAAALVLTERTIEGHLSRIYAKLGVRSRAELAHRFTSKPDPRP
jgi:DNA-binding CsgD family transcriptional regulator/DNA polymerase III delta prime subunit